MDVPSNPAPSLLPDRFGPWRPVRVLGAGGTAIVYLAEHSGAPGRLAAVKALHPGARTGDRARLLRERAILTAVRHPTLVPLADGPQGDTWTALTYLPGTTLGRALRARTGPDLTKEHVARLAEAVAALHRAGWAHGDLKPDNVVLTSDGPVLIDLGHATPASGHHEGSDPSGSFLWCPPERLPHRYVDGRRADVYGLGALLFAVHTGQAPRPGQELPPSLPSDVHTAVQAALAPDPHARPADADAFLKLLRPQARPVASLSPILLCLAVAAAVLLTLLAPTTPAPSPSWVPDTTTASGTRPPARGGLDAGPPIPQVAGLAAAIAAPPVRPGRAPSTPLPSGPPDLDGCPADHAAIDLVGASTTFLLGFADHPTGPLQPLATCLPADRPLTLRGTPKGEAVLNVGRVHLDPGQPARLSCSALLGHCRALEAS